MGVPMAAPNPTSSEARLANLEQLVQEMRARLAALERKLTDPGEHPVDQSVVRKKVTYDWQA
ncbi:MAG: hypothetical protein L3J95_06195 [Thermoplasmata archaeon]|nr:hypothetical protein [Thermoplasmata archaeon]